MIYKTIPAFHFKLGALKNPFSFLEFSNTDKEKYQYINYSSLRTLVVKK